MHDRKFKEKTGTEYELFILAYPHFYDLQRAISTPLEERFRDQHIHVLELGPGSGHTTLHLLEANPNAKIIAVDNEPIMLDQARATLDDHIKSGRVELVQSDALEYLQRVHAESFDAFASGFTLHNFDKAYRTEILENLYSVLKKDSLFVNGDKYAYDDPHEHRTHLGSQLKKFVDIFGSIQNLDGTIGRDDLIREWISHMLDDNHSNIIMHEGELVKQMEIIGFKNIKRTYRKNMEAVYVAIK